jgi:hypothetical protein
VRGVSREEAGGLAERSLSEFIALMAAAGNPGHGRHEIGLRHVEGWILEYDGTIGGSEIQAVIGVDGHIHARRDPRSQRTRKLSAAQWVLRNTDDPEPGARAAEFADHLARILAFDGVEPDPRRGPDDAGPEEKPWG